MTYHITFFTHMHNNNNNHGSELGMRYDYLKNINFTKYFTNNIK